MAAEKTDGIIKIKLFGEVDLRDPFFDSLRDAYDGFDIWYQRKADESAYVVYDDDGNLQAFLYMKLEEGVIGDIDPPLNTQRCLKVGTFKINAHGTRLGERFVKKIMDTALIRNVRHMYVTVFPKHEGLIRILERYGFKKYGIKKSYSGVEDVYLKDMTQITGDLKLDYPLVVAKNHNKWLLAIYPQFHSQLFPDSILKNESASIIDDISSSNSINKAYLGFMGDMKYMKPGDIVVVYRTNDLKGPAWYRSVATSVCVLHEVRAKRTYPDSNSLVQDCLPYSVFDPEKLNELYCKRCGNELYVLKMTYNIAFPKRPTLGQLVEKASLPDPSSGVYYGLMKLSDDQFLNILTLGQVYEGIVIN